MKKIIITEMQAKNIGINMIENTDSLNIKSVNSVIGPKLIRIVISGPDIIKVKDIILKTITKIDSNANISFYDKTNKIVGTVSDYKFQMIKKALSEINNKLTIEKKVQSKALKESKKKIKIRKEQYNRIFATQMINESSIVKGGLNRVDKEFIKQGVNINKLNEISDIRTDVINLIEFLYKKTDKLSPIWEKYELSFDDISDFLLDKKLIVKTNDGYAIKKTKDPITAINNIETSLIELINSHKIIDENNKNNVSDLDVIAFNKEIAICLDKQNNKYVFYYFDIPKNELLKYNDENIQYVGNDENDEPIFDIVDSDIDETTLTNYINDNINQFNIGQGVEDYENNYPLVLIDKELKDELLSLYDKNKSIVKALNSITEMTSASSSGSFVGPITNNVIKKEVDNVIDEIENSGMYDANALPNISRTGEYRKANKIGITKKTQYPDGAFVTFDDCVRLNNNKDNLECNQGAINNVVKTHKTAKNVSAPSLKNK